MNFREFLCRGFPAIGVPIIRSGSLRECAIVRQCLFRFRFGTERATIHLTTGFKSRLWWTRSGPYAMCDFPSQWQPLKGDPLIFNRSKESFFLLRAGSIRPNSIFKKYNSAPRGEDGHDATGLQTRQVQFRCPFAIKDFLARRHLLFYWVIYCSKYFLKRNELCAELPE